MAVDIRTLRIGSHVLVNGKRVRVCGIRPVRSPFNVFQVIIQHEAKIFSSLGYVPSTSNTIEPIPITPALLKELGFEWREDSSCWRKYQNYDGERYDWGIYAFCNHTSKEWCFDLFLPDFKRPRLYAEHLHEIEGQLAYYGVELIKE